MNHKWKRLHDIVVQSFRTDSVAISTFDFSLGFHVINIMQAGELFLKVRYGSASTINAAFSKQYPKIP